MANSERAKQEWVEQKDQIFSMIIIALSIYFSTTDRTGLTKILNDLERCKKKGNQELEDKALDQFQ